jgi:hypothetical protein
MAVAKKKSNRGETIKTTITLDDGQDVNVVIRVGEYEVGHQEKIIESQADFSIIQGRLKYLRKKAVEAETELEYKRARKQYGDYLKKQDDVLLATDTALCAMLAEWDMALTQEDEDAKNFVPLTLEGLKTLDPAIRLDAFAKVVDKAKKYPESEKKDSSASFNGASQTQTELKAASPSSTPESNSLNFMDSALTQ